MNSDIIQRFLHSGAIPLGRGRSDDDGCQGGHPLNDVTRDIVIVVHYATFVAVGFALWAYYKRYNVFINRLWCSYLLLIGLTWLEIGPAFEIGNHYYVNNWQLCESEADLINASFSFFNFGAQSLLALGLRKIGVPMIRCGKSILDWITIVCDWLFVVLIVAQPFVYGFLGRDASATVLSPFAGVASVFILFRMWKNLGPNAYTKWGGILFFILALCGVAAISAYRATGEEWLHIFIGGSFVASVIPLSIGLLKAEMLPEVLSVDDDNAKQGDEEEALTGHAGQASTGEETSTTEKEEEEVEENAGDDRGSRVRQGNTK